MFVRVLNDGFDLGAQRRPRPDLPNDLVCEGGAIDVLVEQRLAIETGKKNKWLQKNSIFAYEIKKEQISTQTKMSDVSKLSLDGQNLKLALIEVV